MTAAEFYGILAAVLVAAATFALLAWVYVRARRESGERGSALDARANEPPAAAEMLDELQQLADRIEGQLEPRLRELTERLAEADRKLEALRDAASEPPSSARPRTKAQQIEALSREGLEPEDIAARLDMTAGEVELILNLRRSSEQG